MTSFPNSPRLVKGGIVLIDSASARVLRIIALQYNPDSLSRTLQVQAAGGDAANRTQPLRFKGPAAETIKLEAMLDATDQLEFPALNRAAAQFGIDPQLAVLESLANPGSAQLIEIDRQAGDGTLEIAPMLAPLTVFVWSRNRVLPVRLTDFSITEEAFDPALHPIRAKVSLGLRVLSVDDLGFRSSGGALFIAYLQGREQLAGRAQGGVFSTLGIGGPT
jgi:hypothetical protein